MKEISISSKTYDEALNKAIIELGTTSDNIDINVVQEGSEGFLGIFGSKPWIIKFKVKEDIESENKVVFNDILEEKEEIEDLTENNQKDFIEEKVIEKEVKKEEKASIKEDINVNQLISVSDKFIKDIFKAIKLDIETEYDYNNEDNSLNIKLVSNQDMGVIIGKRGQTLDSLQYLISLLVNKNIEHYIRIKLDTENYRERRKEKLESFAKNISLKVKKTRKPVVLEPMNPYERRIIHSVLQNDPAVTTKSEGEDPFRHIVVVPKNSFKNKKRKIK